MAWAVRRAGPADAGRIAAITVAGWRMAYRGIVSDEFLEGMRHDTYERRWRDRLTAPDRPWLFVAVGPGDQIRAFAYVCEAQREADRHPSLPTGELGAIYADPGWRGTGAGTAVHDAGLQHLAAHGFRHAVLWVLAANTPSRRFYEARGWRCDGVTQQLGLEDLVEIRYSRQLSKV